MEIQWPLLIFSVLLGVTSGSFVFLAVGELRGKFREVRFSGALIALICLAVGGCVSVLHMGHPERATHLLGNLGSGCRRSCSSSPSWASSRWCTWCWRRRTTLACRRCSACWEASWAWCCRFVAGSSYLIAARPAWDSIALP